jgi:hypothetical protein
MDIHPYDVKSLAGNPEFRDLTVEEAIRLLGEKEKSKLNQERDRVLAEIKAKLDDKVQTVKSTR